jgi:hypothetical protein
MTPVAGTIDKVEYLKKHGPLPQFNRAIKFGTDGRLFVKEKFRIQIKKKEEK